MTRTHCKYCRYMKCQSAGMIKEWVMSAYSPRVDKERNLASARKRGRKSDDDFFKRCKYISSQLKDSTIIEIVEEMESNYVKTNCIECKVMNNQFYSISKHLKVLF